MLALTNIEILSSQKLKTMLVVALQVIADSDRKALECLVTFVPLREVLIKL
jgi:hypothetical protein